MYWTPNAVKKFAILLSMVGLLLVLLFLKTSPQTTDKDTTLIEGTISSYQETATHYTLTIKTASGEETVLIPKPIEVIIEKGQPIAIMGKMNEKNILEATQVS